jgi:hypothetical protein
VLESNDIPPNVSGLLVELLSLPPRLKIDEVSKISTQLVSFYPKISLSEPNFK